MSKIFAIAVPVLPGKEGEWKKWMAELKSNRYNEFAESRKKLGVRERTFLQHTPNGDVVVVTLEGDDPQKAFTEFGKGTDSFTRWFVDSVRNTHGIDLSAPPSGAMPELIIDSHSQVNERASVM